MTDHTVSELRGKIIAELGGVRFGDYQNPDGSWDYGVVGKEDKADRILALFLSHQTQLLERLLEQKEYVTSIVSIDKNRLDGNFERLHPDNYLAKFYVPVSAIEQLLLELKGGK